MVIAHHMTTNTQVQLGANYQAVPGSQRCFASFEMQMLMENAAGLRQDGDYQVLLHEWRQKVVRGTTATILKKQGGAAYSSDPVRDFRVVQF